MSPLAQVLFWSVVGLIVVRAILEERRRGKR